MSNNMKMKVMKTWFKLPVNCMPSEVGGWMEHVNFGVKGLSSHHCEAIDDAINNHDRLVEENAELREALQLIKDKLNDANSLNRIEAFIYMICDSKLNK